MSETIFRCFECSNKCECNIIQTDGKYTVNFCCKCTDKNITLSSNEFKKFLSNIVNSFNKKYHEIKHNCSICLKCGVLYISNNDMSHVNHKHIDLLREYNEYAQLNNNNNETLFHSFLKITKEMNDLIANINKTCKHLSSFITVLNKLENEYKSIVDMIINITKNIKIHTHNTIFNDFFYFFNEDDFLKQWKEMNIYKGKEMLNMLSQKFDNIKKELYNDNDINTIRNINTTCSECLIDVINHKVFFGKENGSIDILTCVNNDTYTNKNTIQNEFNKSVTTLSSFIYDNRLYLLAGANDSVIKLFKINNEDNSHSVINTFKPHTNQINKIIVSKYIDNDNIITFYSCSDDCNVIQYKYSFNENNIISYSSIIEHNDYVNSICFCNDNTNIVSASAEEDKRIIFYNIQSETIIYQIDNCYCSFRNGLLPIDTNNKLLSGGLNEIFVIDTLEYKVTNIIKAPDNNIGYIINIRINNMNDDILVCTNEGKFMKVNNELTNIEDLPYDNKNNMVIYDFTIEMVTVLKIASNKGINVINISS